MEHADQSLSTRDLASPNPAPEAGAERDDEIQGGSPIDDRESAAPTQRAAAPVGQEVLSERPAAPAPQAPDVVPAVGTAADDQSGADNPDGDPLTPQGSESVEPPAADDVGRAPRGTGEGQSQTDTFASEQASLQPAATVDLASSGSRPRSDNGADGNGTPLSTALSADFQARWESIQTQFVDEPRAAVQDADKLVATVMQKLAEEFAQERERLESQWDRGEDISTEDLRVALQRYRSFFQRLLLA